MAATHLRYLNPFPRNLGEILSRYQKVLVPELNMGQSSPLLVVQSPHNNASDTPWSRWTTPPFKTALWD